MNTIKTTFENIKNFLKTKEGQIIKKYFTIIGYKYTSMILNNNIFHFATEAVLLTMAKSVKTQEKTKETKETEESFPKEYSTLEINEDEYYSNLEFLLGTSSSNESNEADVAFSSKKLGEIFLKFFNEERKKLESDKDIPYPTFQNLLRRAVNNSIIELSEEEEENQDLLEIYLNLEKEKEKEGGNFTLQEFIDKKNEVQAKNDSEKKESNFCVRNSCEIFYYFAQSSVKDFLDDLTSFNQQSSSLIYLVLGLVKYNYSLTMEKLRFLYNYSKKQYKAGKNYAIVKTNQTYDFSKVKIQELNDWVNESYYTANEGFKKRFPNLHSKICYLNENYVSPFTLRVGNVISDSYTITVKYCKQGHEKYTKLRDELVEYVSEKYNITKEKASEYITITKEKIGNSNVVKITIEKFNDSKEALVNAVSKCYELVFKLNMKLFYQKFNEGKDYLLSCYQRFLGHSEEEKEIHKEDEDEKQKLNEEENTKKEEKTEKTN